MKILILSNNQTGLYKFRKELIETLKLEKHRVFVSVPEDSFTLELKSIGVTVIHNRYIDRRGVNPIHDLMLLDYYRWLIRKIKPGIVLTYTIKPNVYGGLLCGRMKIPYISNVTGLGSSIQNGGPLQFLALILYKLGLQNAQTVFFQNEGNRRYMCRHKIVRPDKAGLLPGSGVNIQQHCYEPYPKTDNPSVFTSIGRIMKDKGIEEVLSAAETIKKRWPDTVFRLIGDLDEEYAGRINELQKRGIIEYLGFQKDIHSYIAESHAIVHASYHEGMSNILLEAASTGRPVIATDVCGCIETFEPNVTGIAFRPKDTGSLANAIERFLSLPYREKEKMGKAGREKMVKEFDRRIVTNRYMDEIRKKTNH